MCQAVLTIYQVVVKGYHECPFAVKVEERFVASPVVPTGNTWLVSAYLNLSIRWCVNTGRNVSSRINLFLTAVVLTQVLQLLFVSFMFASLNLVSFLYDGNERIIPM